MAQFIIIRGGQNSGKTTTAGLVYKELLKHAEAEHIFNNITVFQGSLVFDLDGVTNDFSAIVTIKNKKVGIISAGDIKKDLKDEITVFININIDIIICCARSINRTGSSYRMILEDFSVTHKIAMEIFTEYSNDDKLKHSVKKNVVDCIVGKVLNIVENNG